ncbi:hypothetical protein Hanom_Chr02g00172011 [Helianthus anomalus]
MLNLFLTDVTTLIIRRIVQVEINWKEEEFQNLIQDLVYCVGCSSGIFDAVCRLFFREGHFRLPMTKFTGEVLTNYGLQISQINALGLPRITHFEFICKANRVEPTLEKFNVFLFRQLHWWFLLL